MDRSGRALIFACAISIAAATSAQAAWQVYSDAAGTRVEVPTDLFSNSTGPTPAGEGSRYTTADHRAELSIFVRPTEGQTPAAYLRANMPDEPSKLDYIRVTSSFFAVSKYKGDRVLYRRCNFERQPARMHCIDLSYPAREERAWDQTVTRISRSLRPLRG
jgi:hypothetical protein